MAIHTNHNVNAFNAAMEQSHAWLQSRLFASGGYAAETILDRMMQRLVELALYPYSKSVALRSATPDNCLPQPGTRMDCGRVLVESGSGRVTVSLRQWIANQLDFLLHWLFCLVAIVDTRYPATGDTPAALVFGIGDDNIFRNQSDRLFIDYCRRGPLDPLRDGKRFFVQSARNCVSAERPEYEYCSRPLIGLLRRSALGFTGRISLLARHIAGFAIYFAASLRAPVLSVIGKDFAYSRISFALDERRLIESIVLTCADQHAQPLWTRSLRHATVHMVWYSQVARRAVYAIDRIESVVPAYLWMRVDLHWVWTHALAAYLSAHCHDKTFRVVGPIVWQLPETSPRAGDRIEIAVFDVSPCSDDIAIACGEITNYFHPDNLFRFMRELIALKQRLSHAFGVPVILKLKTKRGYHPDYDKPYFDFLDEANATNAISMVHHTTNLYSLISGSHLAIVYPFSSPAYVADFIKVPSIYFDPTGAIVRQEFSDPPSLIAFANSTESLFDAASSALRREYPSALPAHAQM